MKKRKTDQVNKVSAYIHIPFCEHICYYCDFNKVFLEGQPVDEYVDKLVKEMLLIQEEFPAKAVETVYIGGGTPTALSEKQLSKLFEGIKTSLPLTEGNEFTVEANPGDITQEKLRILKNFGVNRLSMGVQSFDNELLKKIGRKHTVKEVYETIKLLQNEQFSNISIDLIYALPGQTMESFQDTLDKAIALDIPHYSLYSLILENKTTFMNWARQGRLMLPDQEIEARMFEETMNAMAKAGRYQYEVSNFAIKGSESQHNLMYWNNEHYYGFGAGASGYLGNIRYRNHGPIQHYLQSLRENNLPVIAREELTRHNQMEEEMFLGLRKTVGVSKEVFEKKFGVSLMHVYKKPLEMLLEKKLIIENNNSISLSTKGLMRGNDVFEAFLFEKE